MFQLWLEMVAPYKLGVDSWLGMGGSTLGLWEGTIVSLFFALAMYFWILENFASTLAMYFGQ